MTDPELYRMAYNAECDGYDRKWHAAFAKNRGELDALVRGANQAAADLRLDEERFKPTLIRKHER